MNIPCTRLRSGGKELFVWWVGSLIGYPHPSPFLSAHVRRQVISFRISSFKLLVVYHIYCEGPHGNVQTLKKKL